MAWLPAAPARPQQACTPNAWFGRATIYAEHHAEAGCLLRRVLLEGGLRESICCCCVSPCCLVCPRAQSFDDLLLMNSGGHVIYHGSLGQRSHRLIAYFEAIPGVPRLQEGLNPGTLLLRRPWAAAHTARAYLGRAGRPAALRLCSHRTRLRMHGGTDIMLVQCPPIFSTQARHKYLQEVPGGLMFLPVSVHRLTKQLTKRPRCCRSHLDAASVDGGSGAGHRRGLCAGVQGQQAVPGERAPDRAPERAAARLAAAALCAQARAGRSHAVRHDLLEVRARPLALLTPGSSIAPCSQTRSLVQQHAWRPSRCTCVPGPESGDFFMRACAGSGRATGATSPTTARALCLPPCWPSSSAPSSGMWATRGAAATNSQCPLHAGWCPSAPLKVDPLQAVG